jgi:hypothetical protein
MARADPTMHEHEWRASITGRPSPAGPFQRFFAKLSMFGTAAAVIVSLAIGLL